jgi:hypothetical protein
MYEDRISDGYYWLSSHSEKNTQIMTHNSLPSNYYIITTKISYKGNDHVSLSFAFSKNLIKRLYRLNMLIMILITSINHYNLTNSVRHFENNLTLIQKAFKWKLINYLFSGLPSTGVFLRSFPNKDARSIVTLNVFKSKASCYSITKHAIV